MCPLKVFKRLCVFVSSLGTGAENRLRALDFEKESIIDKINGLRGELSELEVNLESRNIVVKEPPSIGASKLICGRCHHRGHRNCTANPCNIDKCTGYTYCGQREKHPEYIGETNQAKAAIKKTRERIEALESQLNSLTNFETQSEYQFIKNIKPRLFSLNSSYAQNKPMLMRDLRLLRTHLKGKIPPVTTNDSEQLGILLEKCKRELRNKIGNEYSMLSTATINDHPGPTTANGQGSTINVFNISPRTKSSNKPKTKSSMKRNKNGHNPKDIEDDYSYSSQSEESDVNSDESKYSTKKKRQRRKEWFSESRNRYRQLEPSFNYPFPYHPYHYSTNPMAMPM